VVKNVHNNCVLAIVGSRGGKNEEKAIEQGLPIWGAAEFQIWYERILVNNPFCFLFN
jgi:hypothetical protein